MNDLISRRLAFSIPMLALLPAVSGASAGTYHNLRYEDPAVEESQGWSDSLKNFTMAESDFVSLSIGGQARLRWEFWGNFGLVPENDDDFGFLFPLCMAMFLAVWVEKGMGLVIPGFIPSPPW